MSSSHGHSKDKDQNLAKEFEVAIRKALTYDVAVINTGTADEVKEALAAWTACRKLVSRESLDNDQVLKAASLPETEKLLALVHVCKTDAVSIELLWILTNLLSADSRTVSHLVALGVADCINVSLQSQHAPIVVQALWAMGNLAGDESQYRDMLLRAGVAASVIASHKRELERESQRATQTSRDSKEYREYYSNLTWSVCNLVRGKPLPAIASIAPLYPFMRSILLEQCFLADAKVIEATAESKSDDESWGNFLSLFKYPLVDAARFDKELSDIFLDSFWFFVYLSEREMFATKIVRDAPLMHAFCTALATSPRTASPPIIRILGNIGSQSNEVTQAGVDRGAVFVLKQVLVTIANGSVNMTNRKASAKEALWALSNYAADVDANVKLLQEDCGFIDALRKLSEEFDPLTGVPQEAFILQSNMITHPSGIPSDMDELKRTLDMMADVLIRMAPVVEQTRIASVLHHTTALESLYYDLASAHPTHSLFADVELWATFAAFGKEISIPSAPKVKESLCRIVSLMQSFLHMHTPGFSSDDFNARVAAIRQQVKGLLAKFRSRPKSGSKGKGTVRSEEKQGEGEGQSAPEGGSERDGEEDAVGQPAVGQPESGTYSDVSEEEGNGEGDGEHPEGGESAN